jgi:flagellar protein FliO/FliZ
MNAAAAALAAVLLFSAHAAAAQGASPEPSTAGGLLQATLGLALVLGLLAGAAWLAKRVAPGVIKGGVPLRVVASQAVGQRERVVVVEVADQWLVLGVAPGRVNALSTMPKGALPIAPPSAPATSFTEAVSRALGRKP